MERPAQSRELKRLVLIGLFAKDIQANTRSRVERVERDGATERSVLILARKLHKTKEAGMPELYVSRQICRSISLATGKEIRDVANSCSHARTFFDQTASSVE